MKIFRFVIPILDFLLKQWGSSKVITDQNKSTSNIYNNDDDDDDDAIDLVDKSTTGVLS